MIPPSRSVREYSHRLRCDRSDSASLHARPGRVCNVLPIAIQLTNLESLKIERAGLADVSFLAGLVKLERLDLDYNRIENLAPLSSLTRLVELDLT